MAVLNTPTFQLPPTLVPGVWRKAQTGSVLTRLSGSEPQQFGAAGRPELTPHALRHTAASWAIASGADVKSVQEMLGHTSAAMTLDIYGHLWARRLDEVAAKVGDMVMAELGAERDA